MALTVNNHHYRNTSSTISTYPNYSVHPTSDFLLSLPSKSSTGDIMASSKHSWYDFNSDSSPKIIKDETFDCDIMEIPSLQTNDINYRIIDSDIDPLNLKTHHTNKITPIEKKKKTETKERM